MKKIPFPQANNLGLIFNILFYIGPEGVSKYDVSQKYNIDEREGSYYLDALYFIGLVEKINTKYFLNARGTAVRLLSSDDAKDGFCKEVLSHSFLSSVYDKWKSIDNPSEKVNYLASVIYNGNYGLNAETSKRRASSINSWFCWIEDNEK